MLDVAPITIGRNAMFGPLSLGLATLMLGPQPSLNWLAPISIGDECAGLGGTVVVAGVTIGPRTVSLRLAVTKDLPADVPAAGNPARITEP